jgi:hypothetical protein
MAIRSRSWIWRPSELSLDTKVLDSYVGNYELFANFILTVSREDNQLFVQATSQPRAAVYSKSNVEFFFKTVDAQITFETDAQGRATALVLHQGGRDQHGQRISDAEATRLADYIAQHLKEQKPNPGSEASIRRQLEELQRRQPNLEEFTPGLRKSHGRRCPTEKT